MGYSTVTVNPDGQSGRFDFNDGSGAGTWDCGWEGNKATKAAKDAAKAAAGKPVAERARIEKACRLTAELSHQSATLRTTGDVEDACACTAALYHGALIGRSKHLLEAFVSHPAGEVFVPIKISDSADKLPSGDPVRESALQTAVKARQCNQYIGSDSFDGAWRFNGRPSVPMIKGPARYSLPTVSATTVK